MYAVKQECDNKLKITEHQEKSFLKISFKLDPYDDDIIYMGQVVEPFVISDDEDDELLYISMIKDEKTPVKSEDSAKPDIKVNTTDTYVSDTVEITGINIVAKHIKSEIGTENKGQAPGIGSKPQNQTKIKGKSPGSGSKSQIQTKNKGKSPGSGSKPQNQNKKKIPNGKCRKKTSTPKDKTNLKLSAQETTISSQRKTDDAKDSNGNVSNKPSGLSTECFLIKKEKDNDVIYMGEVEPSIIHITHDDDQDDDLIYISTTRDDDMKVETAVSGEPYNTVNPTESDVGNYAAENEVEIKRKSPEISEQQKKKAKTQPKNTTTMPEDSNNPNHFMERLTTQIQNSPGNEQITNNNVSIKPSGQNLECIQVQVEETRLPAHNQGSTAKASSRSIGQNTDCISTDECIPSISPRGVNREPGQHSECTPIPRKSNKEVQTTAMFPKNPDFQGYAQKLGYLYRNSKVYYLKYAKDFKTQDEYMFVYSRNDNIMRVFMKCKEEEYFMKAFYDLVTGKYAFEWACHKMLPYFRKYVYRTMEKRRFDLSHPDHKVAILIPDKLVIYANMFIIMAINGRDGAKQLIFCPTYNCRLFRTYSPLMQDFSNILTIYETGTNVIAEHRYEFGQLKENFLYLMSCNRY